MRPILAGNKIIEIELSKTGTTPMASGERQIGIAWTIEDDYVATMAKGFRDKMVELNDGISIFEYNPYVAKERYMRDADILVNGVYGWDNRTVAGERGFDTVDFAWWQGHGNYYYVSDDDGDGVEHGGVFNNSYDQYRYRSSQLIYGEGYDLEYLIIHSCHSLDTDWESELGGPRWALMRNQTFKGLHMIFGFDGIAHYGFLTRNEGRKFAECLHDGYTFIQAWHEAISDAWICPDTSGVIWCGTSLNDLNERQNESLTNVYPDISNPTHFAGSWHSNDY